MWLSNWIQTEGFEMAISVFIVDNGEDPLMQIGELTRTFDLEWEDTVEMIKEMAASGVVILVLREDWMLVRANGQVLKYVRT